MADFNFDFNDLSPIRQRLDEEDLPTTRFGEGPFAWQYSALRNTAQNLARLNEQLVWQDHESQTDGLSQLNEELSMNVQRHFEGSRGALNPPTSSSQSHNMMSVAALINHDDSAQPSTPALPGCMDRSSAFRLDSNPTQLSFLEWYPLGNGTLTFHGDDNELESIHNVNVDIIEERCAVLAMAFEHSRSGPRLYLETLTCATALPFLRFLYSGTYALKGANEDMYEDVPTSVLFHSQLYRLGDIYELPELKSQAYVNILRQCEFGCSSPDKPIDLCGAIRYIYEHLRRHENLVDAIINYCVSCFLRHHLADDEEFKKLAYELRPFHQALCQNSMNREFENETASAIIQMPFKAYVPETYWSREDPAAKRFDDVVYHFHANDDIDVGPKKRKRQNVGGPSNQKQTSLPLRPHQSSVGAEVGEGAAEDVVQASSSKRRASTSAKSPAPIAVPVADEARVSLPLTSRNADVHESTEGSDSEKEYFKVTRELVPSSASLDAQPDPEFEVVQNAGDIEEALHNDSDSDTLVEITQQDAESPSVQAASAAIAADAEGDSESEWTLV